MKKMMTVLVCGVTLFSAFTGDATAQRTANTGFAAPVNIARTGAGEDVKVPLIDAPDPGDKTAVKELKATLRAAKISLKLSNHLRRNFKNASAVSRNEEGKVIAASFRISEKSARVVYDKRGNWLYSVITYKEEDMPSGIRSQVKERFYGFRISMVQEVSQGGVHLYVVHLEDDTSLKQVIVHENEITVYREYQKSR